MDMLGEGTCVDVAEGTCDGHVGGEDCDGHASDRHPESR